MKYYRLWGKVREGDALLSCGPNVETPFDNWLDPAPWTIPVPEPLVLHIRTKGRLLPFYINPFPVILESMLAKIRSVGVDNIDDYEVLIFDPDTGEQTGGYRALKIIGAIAAIDESKSEGEPIDDSGLAGMLYDTIILDESRAQDAKLFRLEEKISHIVVAEPVKEALLSEPGSESLRFTPLFETDDDDD